MSASDYLNDQWLDEQTAALDALQASLQQDAGKLEAFLGRITGLDRTVEALEARAQEAQTRIETLEERLQALADGTDPDQLVDRHREALTALVDARIQESKATHEELAGSTREQLQADPGSVDGTSASDTIAEHRKALQTTLDEEATTLRTRAVTDLRQQAKLALDQIRREDLPRLTDTAKRLISQAQQSWSSSLATDVQSRLEKVTSGIETALAEHLGRFETQLTSISEEMTATGIENARETLGETVRDAERRIEELRQSLSQEAQSAFESARHRLAAEEDTLVGAVQARLTDTFDTDGAKLQQRLPALHEEAWHQARETFQSRWDEMWDQNVEVLVANNLWERIITHLPQLPVAEDRRSKPVWGAVQGLLGRYGSPVVSQEATLPAYAPVVQMIIEAAEGRLRNTLKREEEEHLRNATGRLQAHLASALPASCEGLVEQALATVQERLPEETMARVRDEVCEEVSELARQHLHEVLDRQGTEVTASVRQSLVVELGTAGEEIREQSLAMLRQQAGSALEEFQRERVPSLVDAARQELETAGQACADRFTADLEARMAQLSGEQRQALDAQLAATRETIADETAMSIRQQLDGLLQDGEERIGRLRTDVDTLLADVPHRLRETLEAGEQTLAAAARKRLADSLTSTGETLLGELRERLEELSRTGVESAGRSLDEQLQASLTEQGQAQREQFQELHRQALEQAERDTGDLATRVADELSRFGAELAQVRERAGDEATASIQKRFDGVIQEYESRIATLRETLTGEVERLGAGMQAHITSEINSATGAPLAEFRAKIKGLIQSGGERFQSDIQERLQSLLADEGNRQQAAFREALVKIRQQELDGAGETLAQLRGEASKVANLEANTRKALAAAKKVWEQNQGLQQRVERFGAQTKTAFQKLQDGQQRATAEMKRLGEEVQDIEVQQVQDREVLEGFIGWYRSASATGRLFGKLKLADHAS